MSFELVGKYKSKKALGRIDVVVKKLARGGDFRSTWSAGQVRVWAATAATAATQRWVGAGVSEGEDARSAQGPRCVGCRCRNAASPQNPRPFLQPRLWHPTHRSWGQGERWQWVAYGTHAENLQCEPSTRSEGMPAAIAPF